MGLPYNAQRPSPTPPPCGVKALPAELLEEIFTFAAHEEALSLVNVLCVNRQWNEVVTASPRTWQYISLDAKTRSISSLHGQARLWIERSAPLPYYIQVDIEDVNACYPALSPFVTSLDRWASLTYVWCGRSYPVDVPKLPSEIFALGINVRDPEAWQPAPDTAEEDIDFTQFMPWFNPHIFLFTMSKLPQPEEVVLVHLTELTIAESSSLELVRPDDILQFVSAFPQITRLVLHLFAQDVRTSDVLPPVVTLPSLKHLEILNTFAPRLFLSRLNTPELRALRLVNLNVHHTLTGGFDIADDGDSSDEAGDFSQSPWSDHGIGMGLRSLLRRSRPPLEILDMDYADMRTKDFRWCFDHLTTLRAFRIVGSDMSDKVVGLLRPYSQHSEDGAAKRAVLRMPNLSRLDLTGCLRVTGDAVVATLRAREWFINNTPDATRLKEVMVVRCPGVDTDHDDALEDLLGARFRSAQE